MEKMQELKFPTQRATVPLSVVLSKTEDGYATHLRDYTSPEIRARCTVTTSVT